MSPTTQTTERGSMASDEITRVFDKLDELQREMNVACNGIRCDVNELNVEFKSYTSSKASCKDRCDKTHDAVFGNGTPGLKAKMWVVWGMLTAGGGVLLGIIKGWIGN